MQHRTKQGDPRSTKKRAKDRDAVRAKCKRDRKREQKRATVQKQKRAIVNHENIKWRAAQRAKRAAKLVKKTKGSKRSRVVGHCVKVGNPKTAQARRVNRREQLGVERRGRARGDA